MSTAALEHSMDLTVPTVRSRLLQLAKNTSHYLFPHRQAETTKRTLAHTIKQLLYQRVIVVEVAVITEFKYINIKTEAPCVFFKQKVALKISFAQVSGQK